MADPLGGILVVAIAHAVSARVRGKAGPCRPSARSERIRAEFAA